MINKKYRNDELTLDELTDVSGGYELTDSPDIRIDWLLGHNIRCPYCKESDDGMIDVIGLAANKTDAQCQCHSCGKMYRYRLVDNHIYLVI